MGKPKTISIRNTDSESDIARAIDELRKLEIPEGQNPAWDWLWDRLFFPESKKGKL